MKFLTEWACPVCGAKLLYRHGSHGHFLGCSKYPTCKGNKNLSALREFYISEAIDKANEMYASDSLYLKVSRCDIDSNLGYVSVLLDSCLNNMNCHIRVAYNISYNRFEIELIT